MPIKSAIFRRQALHLNAYRVGVDLGQRESRVGSRSRSQDGYRRQRGGPSRLLLLEPRVRFTRSFTGGRRLSGSTSGD